MKKLLHKLHLWLSIPVGLIITLICFSGAMLVFETEICEAIDSDLYRVKEVKSQPKPLPELLREVEASLPDSVEITGVNIPAEPHRAYQVNLSKPSRASIYIDQYTGEINGKYERKAFFTTMFRLHRWLLNAPEPGEKMSAGKMVVGVSTILFTFILITGIIVWIPKTWKGVRNRLTITTTRGLSRFWYDLHLAGGMYAAIFLLVMALTGLTWSFPWYRTAFHAVFGIETPAKNEGHHKPDKGGAHKRSEERKEISDYAQWETIYNTVRAANPIAKSYSVSNGNAGANVGAFACPRATNRYKYDTATGQITETDLYAERPGAQKIQSIVYAVHVGSWGGTLTRILAFVAALIGATLPITGYYLWLKKKFKKKSSKK